MRLKRKRPTEVCQNCKHSNNKKGKWKRTWKRRDLYNKYEYLDKHGYWHIYCEKHKKYYPWDWRKGCIELRDIFKRSNKVG